ncbi:MAG: hypothetical protein GY832_25965 [Chloroflexi bacterium]|nr:hypothetical protein [Chloroflexota bacterium]
MSEQPVVQIYNDQQYDLLRTHFWTRNEPNVAWRHAVSSVMALPALRAFWPMSSVDYAVASRARDVAGGGYHLEDINTVAFGYDQLVPYVQLIRANNEHLRRLDGGAANWADITGTEAYVLAKNAGLAVGGWFNFDSLPVAAIQGLMGKYNAAIAQRSYLTLLHPVAVVPRAPTFLVSGNGVATVMVEASFIPTIGSWHYIVGRFMPGAELAIFVSDTDGSLNKFTNLAGVPAAAFDGTADFEIGGLDGTAIAYMNGRASMCWLCAAAVSDSIITALYHQQRKMFGI